MKAVVLGLGNTLLCDDGVGIYTVERLQSLWKGDGSVAFVDGGTLSFTLTHLLADADNLIVIDAGLVLSAILYKGRSRAHCSF